MKSLAPYLVIARINNAVTAGIAVALGFWLGGSRMPWESLALLFAAAVASTGFGNVINDIRDRAADRINHPDRPLPRGDLSLRSARLYAAFLAFMALMAAAFVSPLHCAGVAVPLALLTLYALFLKATRLAGNALVSLLVAYPLLFGGTGAPLFGRLLIPAALAFLLNFAREIVKSLQDEAGDRAAGIMTTARLPFPVIRTIVYCITGSYLALLFLPLLLGQFGTIYAAVSAIGTLPLHAFWMFRFVKSGGRPPARRISLVIKAEMAAGLVALAADQLFK